MSTWRVAGGEVRGVMGRLGASRLSIAFWDTERHLATGVLCVQKRDELSDECFKRAGYCFDTSLAGWGRQKQREHCNDPTMRGFQHLAYSLNLGDSQLVAGKIIL